MREYSGTQKICGEILLTYAERKKEKTYGYSVKNGSKENKCEKRTGMMEQVNRCMDKEFSQEKV